MALSIQKTMKDRLIITIFRLIMFWVGMNIKPIRRKMTKHSKSMARSIIKAESDFVMGILCLFLYKRGRASSILPGIKLPAAMPASTAWNENQSEVFVCVIL